MLRPQILYSDTASSERNLLIAHGYQRSGDFYSGFAKKLIDSGKFRSVTTFDFPGHGNSGIDISFHKGLEILHDIISHLHSNTLKQVEIYGHSFGALSTAYLCRDNQESDVLDDVRSKVSRLFLSSLPIAVNKQRSAKLVFERYGGLSHQEFLNRLPKHLYKKIVIDGVICIGGLKISDWSAYAQEFITIPTTTEIDSVSIPTTLIRARVDGILQLGVTQSGKYFGYSGFPQAYKNLDSKFTDGRLVVIPWGTHGLGFQKEKPHPKLFDVIMN